MERNRFLQISTALLTMGSLSSLKTFANGLSEQESLMPALFIGHGSPMNGIQGNEFSHSWQKMGKEIPQPKAVLCVSAHWLTSGTQITAMPNPRTIHDFGGFPKELYEVNYPAPGSPELAATTASIIKKTSVHLDHEWGLDHGTWTVVRHMYPDANIPVLQLSIDYNKPAQYHYELAQELAALRKKGVLIIGSGNMVHNLGMVAWDKLDNNFGFDWAIEMNELFKKNIVDANHQSLINYQSLSPAARLAIPSPDHYFPLIYTLGLQQKNEQVSFFNDTAMGGSLTMTSVKIG